MSDFSKAYTDLLITQYSNKSKAFTEIKASAEKTEEIFVFLQALEKEMDIDNATGHRLDILGKWVGISRSVPYALPKLFFGFDDSTTSRSFADVFDSSIESAPFKDLFEQEFAELQLNDNDYRFFIKLKIAINNTSAYMINNMRLAIQKVIDLAFGGQAYVIDNQDMSLILHIQAGFNEDRLRIIKQLNLLPKPQGVRYSFVIVEPIEALGFDGDPNAKGFADLFDTGVQGGAFANLLF